MFLRKHFLRALKYKSHKMYTLRPYFILLVYLVLLGLSSCQPKHTTGKTYVAKGRTVEVVGSPGNYKLYRHGKPYFIK